MTILNFTKDFTSEQNEALQSYSETLAFIVADIFGNPPAYKLFSDQHPENESGFVERLNICIAWAKEFEQINESREWDGEWHEEMENFISSKLKK